MQGEKWEGVRTGVGMGNTAVTPVLCRPTVPGACVPLDCLLLLLWCCHAQATPSHCCRFAGVKGRATPQTLMLSTRWGRCGSDCCEYNPPSLCPLFAVCCPQRTCSPGRQATLWPYQSADTHTHTHTRARAHTHTYTHTYTHAHTRTHTHAHVHREQ